MGAGTTGFKPERQHWIVDFVTAQSCVGSVSGGGGSAPSSPTGPGPTPAPVPSPTDAPYDYNDGYYNDNSWNDNRWCKLCQFIEAPHVFD